MAASFLIIDDVFTTQELDLITATGEHLVRTAPELNKAKVYGRRHCEIAWLVPSLDMTWLYERMEEVANYAALEYRIALRMIMEPLQYAAYEPGGYFDWHPDARSGTIAPRVMSLCVQLSEPSDYGGGALEIMKDGKTKEAQRRRGTVVVFPSDTVHRVTPVVRGVRRSLVGWVA